MGITEDDYYCALSISPDSDYEIHLKRSRGSCFVNDYNPVLLKAWEATLDIQPVHNYFKALTYMTTYFSKPESEVLESLKQAAKEIKNKNLNVRDAVKKNSILIYKFMPTLSTRNCI